MIVVDAGHGGDDPGASGNGIVEKNLTLKIAQYIYNRFKELGIPTTMTRTTDETVTPEERVRRILNALGSSSDVVVLSNHINSGGGDGAEVIYALRNKDTLSKDILQAMAAAGQNARKWYQRRLPSDTSKDYYFIHRNTDGTEPVIIEYGFLDSTGDDVNLLKNHWQELAEAVVKGVTTYKGLPYDNKLTGNQYTVKSGDSLYSIASKYGVTTDAIKSANDLTSNTLSIGQILTIPVKTSTPTTGTTYTVKSGDNLYSIASKYGVTTDAIKSANNLSSNLLSIGQVLKIPTTSATTGTTYTVKTPLAPGAPCRCYA